MLQGSYISAFFISTLSNPWMQAWVLSFLCTLKFLFLLHSSWNNEIAFLLFSTHHPLVAAPGFHYSICMKITYTNLSLEHNRQIHISVNSSTTITTSIHGNIPTLYITVNGKPKGDIDHSRQLCRCLHRRVVGGRNRQTEVCMMIYYL